jgi:DNA-binding response OmpR family regulator
MNTRQNLLVVNDDVLVRIALAEYLRACGHRAIEAASILEARTVLQDGPDITIVLACAQLKGGAGGFGLVQWARRHRPNARVVLSGALAKKIEAAEALCGGDAPCSGEVLLQRIQGARSRKRGPKRAGEARNRSAK